MNELLETSGFCNRDLKEVHQDLNVPIPDAIVINHSEDGPVSKKMKLENSIESAPSGTKVMVLSNGPIPCNKPLCDLILVVKPYIRQLLEDSNLVNSYSKSVLALEPIEMFKNDLFQLKMWISFMIPKIEDGNNFGVSIQEDTLAEVQAVESEAAAFFDQISR